MAVDAECAVTMIDTPIFLDLTWHPSPPFDIGLGLGKNVTLEGDLMTVDLWFTDADDRLCRIVVEGSDVPSRWGYRSAPIPPTGGRKELWWFETDPPTYCDPPLMVFEE